MRVAIIGAGLSGLACAHEFERHKIYPDIYEKTAFASEILDFPAALLKIFNSPVRDPLKFLNKEYGIELNHHYVLKEMTMVGPSKKCVIKGKLGCIIRRGTEVGTLTNQILSSIKSKINFDTYGDVNELRKSYDYVIVATGDTEISGTLNTFTDNFNAYARIATVKGNFKTNSVTMWLNTVYAKHGYGYLVPDTTDIGKLVLIIDIPSNAADTLNHIEFEEHWERFLKMNKLNYEITDFKDVQHRIGTLSSNVDGNVYYVGMAGGFIDSLLGFGSLKAVISGAAAAKCISEGLDYDKFINNSRTDIERKYEYRKAYDSVYNNEIDMLISLLNIPGVKQILYNNPLYKAYHAIPLIRLFNFFKRNTKKT